MAEALKNIYHSTFLSQLAARLHSAWPGFDEQRFLRLVFVDSWEESPLKTRMRIITRALGDCLPERYPDALEVLYKIDRDCTGLPFLIFPDFVEQFGRAPEHWELSMTALARFTRGSSSEFAVRPFLLSAPERMMRQMTIWAQDADEHVRRLASEGCRPRLPWGQALPMFKQQPAPILPILEQLKQDESLYVRKSVANNLNDIAKDNPQVVRDIAHRWLGTHPHTDWIVRHGCRTLIRRDDPQILALFGYSSEQEGLVEQAKLELSAPQAAIGERIELSYELRVRAGGPVKIRIEYAIGFVKANGRSSEKRFLLSDRTVAGGTRLSGSRRHNWADLTTRKHYPGSHRIRLLVGGIGVAEAVLELHAQGGVSGEQGR
ncbi:DNA alkylation repair protein [Paenibacillus sp. 1P07SE]|uniref:DNA alkylation repair protein n=1 Tax=Paenibacillus sp. 1P07SE TaxID=3132209 RepID=UPI0039A6871A